MNQTIKILCTICMLTLIGNDYLHSQALEFDVKTYKNIPFGFEASQTIVLEDEVVVMGIAPPSFGIKYKDILAFPTKRQDDATVEIKVPFENTYSYRFLNNTKELTRIILRKDKKERKVKKYFQTFDQKGFHKEVNLFDSAPYEKYEDLPFVVTTYSPNRNNVLIADVFDKDKKKRDFYQNLVALDADLNVINKWEIKNTLSQKQVDVARNCVSNTGDISYLEKRYKDKKAKRIIKQNKKKVIGFDYIFHIKRMSGEEEEVKFDFDGHFIKTGLYDSTSEGDYVFFFPFYPDHKKETVVGFLSYHVDGESLAVAKHKHEFTDDELSNFGMWSKSNPGLDDKFWISPIVAQAEGKTAFALERVKQKNTNSGLMVTMMSLVSFVFDKDGKYETFLHVPKAFKNHGVVDFTSFHFVDGKLHAFYMDNRKNAKRDNKDYKKFKGTWFGARDYLYYAYMEDGSTERVELSEEFKGGKIGTSGI